MRVSLNEINNPGEEILEGDWIIVDEDEGVNTFLAEAVSSYELVEIGRSDIPYVWFYDEESETWIRSGAPDGVSTFRMFGPFEVNWRN